MHQALHIQLQYSLIFAVGETQLEALWIHGNPQHSQDMNHSSSRYE